MLLLVVAIECWELGGGGGGGQLPGTPYHTRQVRGEHRGFVFSAASSGNINFHG